MMVFGLAVLLLAVLLGPVLVKPIEENIEIFFLVAGVCAALMSGTWGHQLLHAAATEPIPLTIAVLLFGIIAKIARPSLEQLVGRLATRIAPKWLYLISIILLGLLSSVITAVVAALILVEIVALLKLDRWSEIAAVVLACFAIGLGAALTPVGEPLGTVAVAALKVDFWYLARLLGPLVVVGIFIVGAISFLLPAKYGHSLKADDDAGTWADVGIRAGKVYLFVAGLVGLSWSLRPLVDQYISRMPEGVLFWLNSISAIVDNATLTAAEIGPALNHAQQRAILLGLLISGGMLIPGNIPNIVAAGRLGISSREWARVGLVVGFPLMLACFLALEYLH